CVVVLSRYGDHGDLHSFPTRRSSDLWAREEGLRVDTASGGELAVALRAQVPGAEIGLHGNNKSDAEILRALDAGVGRIIVDSLVEIERIAQLAAGRGVVAPVMVRVTTGVHAGG